jgi:hypothetical protein
MKFFSLLCVSCCLLLVTFCDVYAQAIKTDTVKAKTEDLPKKDSTSIAKDTVSKKEVVKSLLKIPKDSLTSLALTAIQLQAFKKNALDMTLQFQTYLNFFANPTISPNELHTYKQPTLALFKKDTICIRNDLRGSSNISVSQYLHLLHVFTEKKRHTITFDSIKVSNIYWRNTYEAKVWLNRIISVDGKQQNNQQRQLIFVFEKDKKGEWQTKITKYLNASPIKNEFVPMRKITLISPQQATTYTNKELIKITWADSVVSQNPTNKKSFVVQNMEEVSIDLYKDRTFMKNIGKSNSNSFEWKVEVDNEYGKNFQFRVTNTKNETLTTISDSIFAVKCDTCKILRYIQFTNTTLGKNTFVVGDTVQFEWLSEGIDEVKIILYEYDETTRKPKANHYIVPIDRYKNTVNHCRWKIASNQPLVGRKFMFKICNYSEKPQFDDWSEVITFTEQNETRKKEK